MFLRLMFNPSVLTPFWIEWTQLYFVIGWLEKWSGLVQAGVAAQLPRVDQIMTV